MLKARKRFYIKKDASGKVMSYGDTNKDVVIDNEETVKYFRSEKQLTDCRDVENLVSVKNRSKSFAKNRALKSTLAYAMKADEARSILRAPDTDELSESDYPMIAAESAAMEVSMRTLAELVMENVHKTIDNEISRRIDKIKLIKEI